MTTIKDYECLECHKRLTLKQAERALNGDSGCPKCGGSDIDLYVAPKPAMSEQTAIRLTERF